MKKLKLLIVFSCGINCSTFGQSAEFRNNVSEFQKLITPEADKNNMVDQMIDEYKWVRTEYGVGAWNKLEAELRLLTFDKLVKMSVPVYQKYFNDIEMKNLVACVKTAKAIERSGMNSQTSSAWDVNNCDKTTKKYNFYAKTINKELQDIGQSYVVNILKNYLK